MSEWLAAVILLIPTTTAAQERPFQTPTITISKLMAEAGDLEPVTALTLGGDAPLRLREISASVETYHPVLAAAEQRRRQAEGDALSARGGFDPVLKLEAELWPEGFYDFQRIDAKVVQPTPLWGTELFGSYRLGRGNLPVYEEEARTLDVGELKAGLSVPLWRDGPIDDRRASIRQTEQRAQAVLFERETARLDLLLESAAAYWKWVLAGRTYLIALDLVRLAETRDEQITKKVQRGAVAEIERAENLRAVLDRRQDLVVAQRELEQAGIKLSLFWRDDDGEPRIPSIRRMPGLPDPTLPRANQLQIGRDLAMQRRPEIDFFRAELERARVGLRLAENQLVPELDFSFSVGKDLGTDKDEEKIAALDPTELKLGLDLKVPFFIRKARGKARKAEAKLSEVGEKARFQRDKIDTQVLNLWTALNAQAQQSMLADETYRVAEAVAAAERRRFDLGATTLFIVNLREQKAAEAARKRVKARADFAITRSAWALATRTTLPADN